ncbi:MAG: HAMP domain-containing histidine kinase [Rhizobacter sp.]|nr:HAMP domain-containing histidine kinase [Bacteriovorax sp.]
MSLLNIKLSKESETAKSKYVKPFDFFLIILGLYFSFTYYVRYEAKVLALCCLLATCGGLLLPVARKVFRTYIQVANYLVAILFFVILGISIFTGGVKASSIWWIGVTPVVAALLLNGFYSIVWFILVTIEIIVLYYLKTHGMLPDSVVPPEKMDQFLTTSTIAGIFLLTTLCIIADTLRERLSLQKEELQSKAFRLTQLASLGSLASGVSHEINNPLAVIKGSQLKIKRMIEGDEPVDKKTLKNYMDKIERNVRRIQEITSSMRAISDKDSHKKIIAINMEELVMSLASMAKERIGQKNILVVTEIKSNELYFSGIYNEIFQAMFNIVDNSMDELIDLNNDQGKIEISLDRTGSDIIISVKDNGRGIPENLRGNIFDPFFTTKGIGQGTGLGLTYSFNVLSYNGGTLELVNQATKGTTFKATLPILQT